MRTTTVIFISIFVLSCTISKQSNNQSILGSWEFISNEVIASNPNPDHPFFKPKNDSTFNLSQFLGPEIINDSPGKTISFTNNNLVNTNLIKVEMVENLNFRYEYNYEDSLLTFTLINPKDSSKIYIPTKTTLHDSIMIWNIDDFLQIKLKRIK